MDKADNGLIIHSIAFGDNPVNSMKWTVGQDIRTKKGVVKISAIVFDEGDFYHYGKYSYIIYVSDDTGTYLWRKYSDVPTSIVYDL